MPSPALFKGRWSEVVEEQKKNGTCNGHLWGMIAEKRRDIYPLVGGKHKKWILYVMCKVNGEVHERKFESCVGYDAEINRDSHWARASEWLSQMMGKRMKI